MNKIRIAIIGASEIAYRRFMPALVKDARFEYVGVAIEREQDVLKAKQFLESFGGEIITGYNEAIGRQDIDAIYVPQPPALHYDIGKRVLLSGKHLFMEKPFTIRLSDTEDLISIASLKKLAIVENYMFRFHKQIGEFIKLAKKDKIVGEVKAFEVCFSFPQRPINDFRYERALGGGALFDCGGYTIMLSDMLLDRKGELVSFESHFHDGFNVDIEGDGVFHSNECDCKFSFGMANPYNCYAKAFGTKGILIAPRVLTAPPDYCVVFDVVDNYGTSINTINVGEDDSFLKSIDNFYKCINDEDTRNYNYSLILRQSILIDKAVKIGGLNDER